MRQITQVVQATGNHIKRFIGTVDINDKGTAFPLAEVSPFILLDRGTVPGPGKPQFGAHPHYGFAVASLFLKGSFKSWDNLQDKWEDDRLEGSVYYVNCGRGVQHEEVSTGEGANSMFQLWMAIPPEERKQVASIQFAPAKDIPEFPIGTSTSDVSPANARLLVGSYGNFTSPILPSVPLAALFVKQQASSQVQIPIPRGWNLAVINNSYENQPSAAKFNDTKVEIASTLVFGDGDYFTVTTEDSSAEYLVLAGVPQPEKWYKLLGNNGAMIGSSREELEAKMAEYEKLLFGFGK